MNFLPLFFLTAWEDAALIVGELWDLVVATLTALESTLATSIFVQIMFAMIVFTLSVLVFDRVVKLVKKIAGK